MTEKPFTPRSVARILAVPTALALAVTLVGCMPGSGTPSTSSSPTASDSSSAPSESPSASPSASPSEAPAPTPSLSPSDIQNIQESISSGNTAALVGYLSNPVHIAAANSDLIDDVTPDVAAQDLEFITTGTGWNWNVDATTLATWRSSAAFGSWLPEGAIIGHAATGQVVSFVVTGDRISSIYIAGDASAFTE